MRRENSWCLEIRLGIFLCLILVVILTNSYLVSAIRINEIEINPIEGSEGNEWIEFYSNEEINITGWQIYDGLKSPRKIFTISNETIIEKKGYYIIELSSAYLNNDGDFVTIYDKEGNKIDETIKLKDITKSQETW